MKRTWRRVSSNRPRLVSGLACAAFLGFAAPGWAAVNLDGSLGPSGPVGSGTVDGVGTTYLISHDLGQLRGANLFHSFSSFDIAAGESATFTGPTDVADIIGRVTGGSPSSIDGLVRSAIDGANLYLVNPAGVMFGPNASLDVSGSFHVSTADYVRLADGNVFYADLGSSSVLSVAAPESFGFLNAQPAGISGDAAYLQVAAGGTLSLVAGEITYTGVPVSPDDIFYMPGVLTAPGGTINLISVASPGEVNLTAADLGIGSFSQLGNISFTQGAKLDVLSEYGALPAGSIVIRGGAILFQDGGMDVYGDPGGTVDIKGDSLQLDNAYVFPASFGEADHPGTGCEIDVSGAFLMTHAALIDTQNAWSGRGGDIRITAGSVQFGDGVIDEFSYSNIGFYGYVATATAGLGKGGDIAITAADVTLQNGFFVNTQTYAEGDAGHISLHADTIEIRSRGNIGAYASGYGRGGDVNIFADEVSISGANATEVVNLPGQVTGIIGLTEYFSDGGTISLTTNGLAVADGGQINTILFGEGRGANLAIDAKNISVSGFLVDQGDYFLSAIDGRVYGPDAIGVGGDI
ncbi:MAG: filamentous hemagglutinin N-terminal domain-containing protein, partial [Proteobacteria bacterium]|nr:filamentous hemagglutinin N-terminal domain-containing protein [Pseudomonadota bacterium]